MENENVNYQDVVFSYTLDVLRVDIHAHSAYIASSLHAAAEQPMDITPFMITYDEEEWVCSELKRAFYNLLSALSAYVLPDSCIVGSDEYRFVIKLPMTRKAHNDSLITHELQRAMVSWVLTSWYSNRLPQEAARQQQLYDVAVATARHDVFMAHGGMKRECNYF